MSDKFTASSNSIIWGDGVPWGNSARSNCKIICKTKGLIWLLLSWMDCHKVTDLKWMGNSRELTPPSFSHLSNTVECFCARRSGRVRETRMKTSQGSRIETCQQSKHDLTNTKGSLRSHPCLPIDSLFLLLFPFCSWEKWGAETLPSPYLRKLL